MTRLVDTQQDFLLQVTHLQRPPGDMSKETTVQIDGTSEQIEAARLMVDEVTSEASEDQYAVDYVDYVAVDYVAQGAHGGNCEGTETCVSLGIVGELTNIWMIWVRLSCLARRHQDE